MGVCKILGGGADGRYQIELDFGSAQKAALLAAINAAINKNALDILQAEAKVAEAEAEEQAMFGVLTDLITAITTGTAEEAANAAIEYPKRAEEAAQLRARNASVRYTLSRLTVARKSLSEYLAQFTTFSATTTRDAWCADLTTNRAAGSYVATMEIKGEPDLVVIAPGARAWNAADGQMLGREMMSPWQVFWNAAVLPGWQKWKPTYRWGTITTIDYDANTCSVALADALSSAQRLGVNQVSTIDNVPISYMTCNAEAFEVGDRVIVQFILQSWRMPSVVGFLDNPFSCTKYVIRYEDVYASNSLIAEYKVRKGGTAFGCVAPERQQPNPFLYWKIGSQVITYSREHPGVTNVQASATHRAFYATDRYLTYVGNWVRRCWHFLIVRAERLSPPWPRYECDVTEWQNVEWSIDTPLVPCDSNGDTGVLYSFPDSQPNIQISFRTWAPIVYAHRTVYRPPDLGEFLNTQAVPLNPNYDLPGLDKWGSGKSASGFWVQTSSGPKATAYYEFEKWVKLTGANTNRRPLYKMVHFSPSA